MEQFSNSELRQRWIRDKGMQVLQFWSDAHRETSVDVFVTEPFAFDEEYARAIDMSRLGVARQIFNRTQHSRDQPQRRGGTAVS
jgi:hypothetical protein